VIISRTPYRLSLFGGGTDFPEWFHQHGGAVLTTTINRYCYVSLRRLPPFFEHRNRVVYSKVETVQDIDEISHPVVRSVLQHEELRDGVEIHYDGDLPARSGVGSSSAFTVGLLHCVRQLQGKETSSWELGQKAVEIERKVLGEPGGVQDQYACAVGGVNVFHFRADGTIRRLTDLPLEAGAHRMSEWLMLLYSGVSRASGKLHSSTSISPQKGDRVLSRLHEMVEEGAEVVRTFTAESAPLFGQLLEESWALKLALNPRAENAELAELARWMVRNGSLGGKISGAGGGGFALFCVPPDRQPKIRAKLPSRWLHVPFSFESSGTTIIFNDQTTGALGTRSLWK